MSVAAAAWVPDDDPARPWDEAADLAYDWLLSQTEVRGGRPLLVTPTQHQWDSVNATRRMAQQFEATTPRSRSNPAGRRPVLAYVPHYDEMQLALNKARDNAIAVVETRSCPLIGWAMETGALDLVAGAPTPDTRTNEQRKAFDLIAFYGNNGWGDSFGKESASRVIRDLQAAGEFDKHLLLGYMVAKGKFPNAVERLGVLVDSVTSGRR